MSGVEEFTGTIRFFKYQDGYGIIAQDNGGPDVFLHKAICEKCGYQDVPSAGMEVRFQVYRARKGLRASWVKFDE